jgi:sugar lactone lactonase YvrE
VAGSAHRRRLVSLIAAVLLAAASAGTTALTAGSSTAAPRFYLVRVDAGTGRVSQRVSTPNPNVELIQTAGGTLWQIQLRSPATLGGVELVARNPRTGTVERRLVTRKGVATASVQVAFGSVWVLWQGIGETKIDRYDARTGRRLTTITLQPGGQPAAAAALFISAKRVWVLDADDKLTPIDPAGNRAGFPISTRTFVGDMHEFGDSLWIIPRPPAGYLLRINMTTQRRTTYPIGFQPVSEGWDGARLWLVRGGLRSRSLVPFDTRTGKAGAHVRLNGAPSGLWVGPGKIWVAAGPVVDLIDTAGGTQRSIRMPHGLCAFAVTGDPASSSVWLTTVVAHCGNP